MKDGPAKNAISNVLECKQQAYHAVDMESARLTIIQKTQVVHATNNTEVLIVDTEKEACDGLGVCDENGQCQCDAPALGACVAARTLIGDGECMFDRKSYKPGGCRSKKTKDACVISKSKNCEWKCFSNASSSGKCVQVDQKRPVACDLITDEAECSIWSM